MYTSSLNPKIGLSVLLQDKSLVPTSTDNISVIILFTVPLDGPLDDGNTPMMEAIDQLAVLPVFIIS
ncbi:hypothetical protein A2U01_0090147, partial [Trifolium medium]|nr:hypothetical protein [Trifolium medium]